MEETWFNRFQIGDIAARFELFLGEHHALMLRVIRRRVSDADEAMDAFAHVCERLVANDHERLRRYASTAVDGSDATPWLTTVVRHLTIDWIRSRDGRSHPGVPGGLSPMHHAIYALVFIKRNSYVEAYEQLPSEFTAELRFGRFLREVRELEQATRAQRVQLDAWALRRAIERGGGAEWFYEAVAPGSEHSAEDELLTRLSELFSAMDADVRQAIELYFVEGLAAADVAVAVGWANAKAVYNRVGRALRRLRVELEAGGMGLDDVG